MLQGSPQDLVGEAEGVVSMSKSSLHRAPASPTPANPPSAKEVRNTHHFTNSVDKSNTHDKAKQVLKKIRADWIP